MHQNTIMYRFNAQSAPRCALAFLLSTSLLAGCATEPPAAPPPPVIVATPAPQPAVTLPIKQGARGVEITLPDSVLFDSGKAELKNDLAAPYLDRLAGLLKTKTEKSVSVEGHTDSQGAVAINQKLSEQRAAAVAAALESRGISAARIERKGFAASSPVAPNDVEAGRRLNRRAEIVILGETVENITRGEPANSFEDAVARVKAALEAGPKK